MHRRAGLVAVAFAIVLWTSSLIAAPSAPAPRLSALVYAAGSLVCHQRPERSFHRDGAQYPVCARCLGLYLGGVVGAVGWVLFSGVRRLPRAGAARWVTGGARRALVIAATPTIITVLMALLGWWDPGNNVRALLAVPLGAAIGATVAAVAARDLR